MRLPKAPFPPSMRAVCCAALLSLAAAMPARADTPAFVWIEGESLARPPQGFKSGGWGNKHYLSGEDWLFAAIDGKDAESLPAQGLTLSYPFEARTAGGYEVWARVGYEFVRSPFKWRVDDNAWGENGPQDLTTDLMDVAEWTEIAWVKLGKVRLDAGKHTLEVRFERRVLPNKQQPERILAGIDCFCLARGTFRPNGPNKPGDNGSQAIDRTAAETTFTLPADPAPRGVLPLKGTWQIARWDEQEIRDRDQPVKELPAGYGELFWKGIPVPGNRDTARPDFLYCHRFLYRTRINVPAALSGRSFVLRFPSTALLASVFVNGHYCGGSTAPCTAWEADATAAIKPGEVNEVVVAVKDCYYALASTGDPNRSIRTMFNTPINWLYNNGGLNFNRFADFPVLYSVHGAGIFETPTLTVAGAAYVSDVFAKPSVRKKELGLEVSVRNPTAGPLRVALSNEVVPLAAGPAEKQFAVKEIDVPAGREETVQLAVAWPAPKLWWPDDPQQYVVVTRLRIGDKVVDEKRTKFGFREWQWQGQHFTLNGVPWHFHADLLHNGKVADRERAAADWKKAGVNTVRYWGYEPWVGDSQEETLDWYDSIGMPIRRTGIFDGQVASYLLVEDRGGKTVARKAIFANWIHQLKAWVKAERNHPSVFIWSVENEITYINLRNFGLLEYCEPEIRRAVETVMALDPTRPAMTDGGDALRDRSLPVYGNHYNETNFRAYPDEAYTMEYAFSRHKLDPRGNPWPIGDDRPLFLGESFFASGFPPAAYSAVMGEAAFLGRSAAEPGVRLFARMLAEGYRWHGIAGFHFWFAGDGPDNFHYKAFQPVCVFCREWDSAFAGGRPLTRTLKVFNDTRSAEPVTARWSFEVAGKPVAGGVEELHLEPGTAKEWPIRFTPRAVEMRTPAQLVLTCSRGSQEVFRDVKQCAVLPADGGPRPQTDEGDILVLDPRGVVAARLTGRGIRFRPVESFDAIPEKVKVLVVGPDALTPRQATDPKWAALAASGARVLVLDQEKPLHYQATPADFTPTPHTGRIAFPENLEHPAFAGLDTPDFFCWSGDHVVYRKAYKKATRGARSLLQCDDELSCSALAEVPVRDGVLLLAQLPFGAKLASDPVAQRLFDNLLAYAAAYKPAARPTATVFPEGDLRLKLLNSSGLKYTRAEDVVSAIADPNVEIVVADASPDNLRKLAGALDKLEAFTRRGNYLMLWGLTPEGLADFNKVVGFPHAIRPFQMERVTLAARRDPVMAGLTVRDVVLEGTEHIYPWAGDRYPAKDTFTHVVDLDDIAPFIKGVGSEHAWRQMTNGLTSADSWKFILYHDLGKEGPKPRWVGELPKVEDVTGFSIVINAHYHRITRMRLTFDDDPAGAVTVDLKPEAELRQDFTIPGRKCRRITLEPVAWDDASKSPVLGVDNIWIKVRRGPDYTEKVVPLLNIGALVKYRMGKGGIVLNQFLVQATEPNPVNAEKKQTVVATMLRNLGAAFAADRMLVAGVHMKYAPVPLEEKCNQFLTADRGWIADAPDLGHLPVGEQKLAGVTYTVRDFKTSPLPSCIMLAGPGARGALPRAVEGIPVNRKADALFFLHTFHKVKGWQPSGDNKEPPVVFEYVVTYADGKSATVPVRLGRGVDHWVAAQPQGLPEASVAWAAPFPKDPSNSAVVYQMTWANPRPAEPIRSLAVRYAEKPGNEYGVPAVLAVTAGTADR